METHNGEQSTKSATVRLDALAKITRTSRESIRNSQKQRRTPWDESEFPEGQYRRYDGAHALALVLVELLHAQGVSLSGTYGYGAAEFVRDQSENVARFLDAVEAGTSPEQVFVSAMFVAEEDSLSGVRWRSDIIGTTGTAAEIIDQFAGYLERTGRVREVDDGTRTVRQIGGPMAAVASVREAYRILQRRAVEAGYVVDGRQILRLLSVTDDLAEAEE